MCRIAHDCGLRVTYSGVKHFSIDNEHSTDWMPVDTVLLDEILPDGDGGCVHELALTDVVITIRCEDLRAVARRRVPDDNDGLVRGQPVHGTRPQRPHRLGTGAGLVRDLRLRPRRKPRVRRVVRAGQP
ncbi:hypothetical protein SCOCK_60170 [Actinacidiphila cocklensis]|uniref:Uncharacterized protein n=1 Tax=Actinacidiphila cocklensis TaxID=887465 RepID=A0A9W4DWT4_9ACTN|nr:hypothetical protein SCOCK_60170 [Actinacidiphila cocklensis]